MVKFSLINSQGTEYDVMPKGYNPAGFGYENAGNYVRQGNRYINTLEYFSQGKPTFSVLFPEETAESDYFNFVNFLQGAPLQLRISYDNHNFYRDVRVGSVAKNWLPVEYVEATVSLQALTLPYKKMSTFTDKSETLAEGKTYDYEYDYTYSETQQNTAYLDVDSFIESPTKIEIYGPCTNPTWNYYRNANLEATGKINTVIPAGRKLVIDTTTTPYSITLQDLTNKVVDDLYKNSDFSTERFIYLSKGRNRIVVTTENQEAVAIGMEGHIYYASI